MRTSLLISLALVPMIAVGCGDDDEQAVTHEEWHEAVCTKLAEVTFADFDQFFTDHPDPTLDDWAAFLPTAVSGMDQFLEAIESTPNAPEDEAAIDDAVGAITTVRDNFATGQQSAEDGDQAAFDEISAQNQDTDVPAMEAAMAAVDDEDCPGQGG